MVDLILKIITHNKPVSDSEFREKVGISCGLLGILINIILFIGKLISGILSSSISIIADAFNNFTDVGSSVITVMGFKLAGQKPDKEHPFGHGRMEYISGFIISVLILIVGFELGKSSLEKIIKPEEIKFNLLAVIILLFSLMFKVYMFLYNRKYGNKIDSASLLAVGRDSLNDCITTSVVLFCYIIFYFFKINIDSYCGLALAVFILISGIKTAKETIDPLLGQAPDEELVKSIYDIVMSHEGIIGMHDLVVHDYGPGRLLISLHAEVPSANDIMFSHDIIDNVEKELSEKLSCEALIHMDPICDDDELVNDLRKKISIILKNIDVSISMHDFRIVVGDTHTNLIFDVVLPYDLRINRTEIKTMIENEVKKIDKTYFTVIHFDNLYI